MRYVVLGAGGQLGRDLCARIHGEVIPLTRGQADVTRRDLLAAALQRLQPDVVINCAAYNFVDRAETEPEIACAVNTWGARALAMACQDLGCLLVHLSTDYVFGLDKARREPWVETDTPGPVSVYGLSKLAGEMFVRSICPRHIIVRTCGLYGTWGSGGKGSNFVETMLKLATEGKRIRVVADQICAPSYTADVASATLDLIQVGLPGLYHLTNSGSCTWHQFAKAIFELESVAMAPEPISSLEYGALASRPRYSVLANDAVCSLGLPVLRPWREALAAYLLERRVRQPLPLGPKPTDHVELPEGRPPWLVANNPLNSDPWSI